MLKEGNEIIGIKKVKSKNSDRIYTTYMCRRAWSDYELDNSEEIAGDAVEEINTSEDFPLHVGDVVKFYYGKAIGNYQPVTDYKLISVATPFDKDKKVSDPLK